MWSGRIPESMVYNILSLNLGRGLSPPGPVIDWKMVAVFIPDPKMCSMLRTRPSLCSSRLVERDFDGQGDFVLEVILKLRSYSSPRSVWTDRPEQRGVQIHSIWVRCVTTAFTRWACWTLVFKTGVAAHSPVTPGSPI